MNVNPTEAERALASIRETEDQMHKAMNASGGGYQMLIWGAIMLIGYTLNQFADHLTTALVASVWIVLSVLGNAVSVVMSARMARKFHSPLGARIGAMLPIFILFGVVAAFFVHPAGPREINLLIYLLVMLWLAMMGLWVKLSMLWISLIFTALMLFGYVVLPDYFFLWLAIVGGGSMIGSGLFLLSGRG
jgi:CHASE2 domain-containing sensor protein